MKVLNICRDDWARFSYDNMLALRSVGIDCDAVAVNSHPYYDEQSEVLHTSEILNRIKQYDVVQFFHDNPVMFQTIAGYLQGKKVIVYHTSSYYRKYFQSVNDIMNPFAHRSVCAMPEFIGKGSVNEVYMVGAVDTDKLVPNMYETKYKFAHFPSNPDVKGTNNIIDVMSRLDVDFVYSKNHVPYGEQIKRISECEVYIEMLTTQDGGGMEYGNFGITALEAAALGKVVITQNNINSDVYNQAYGFCGLNFAKDAAKLRRHVETFANYNGEYLQGQMQITRDWVVKNHSYKASGEYILKNILA